MDKCVDHCPCCGIKQDFSTKICSVCGFAFRDVDELKKRLNIIDAVVGLCKRDKYQEAYNKLKEIEKTKNWETIDVDNYQLIKFFDTLFKYKHDNNKKDFIKYLRKNKDVCVQYNLSQNFIYETICGVLTELDLNDDEKDKDVSSIIDEYIDEGHKRGKNGFSTKSFIDNIENKTFDEVEIRLREEIDINIKCKLFDLFIQGKLKHIEKGDVPIFVSKTISLFKNIFAGIVLGKEITKETICFQNTIKNTFYILNEKYELFHKELSLMDEFLLRKKIVKFYKKYKLVFSD